MTAAPPVPPPAADEPEGKQGDQAPASPKEGSAQCPECGVFLTSDHLGPLCIVDGYPRSRQRPTRPPELTAWVDGLLRTEERAGGEPLADLARRLGLRWGTPNLKPGRRLLHLDSAAGPALAVQEAVGSARYLIVTSGATPWVSGLHQFFVVSQDGEASGARVRLRREALAELAGDGGLTCLEAGEVEVLQSPVVPPPAVQAMVARPIDAPGPQPVAVPPAGPTSRLTLDWRLKVTLFGVFLLVGIGLLVLVSGGGSRSQPVPASPTTAVAAAAPPEPESTLERTGSLEVTTNCPATGDIDSFYAPDTKRQPSHRLRWFNLRPRAHSLKLRCVGFEPYTKRVSIEPDQHLVLPTVELQRLGR